MELNRNIIMTDEIKDKWLEKLKPRKNKKKHNCLHFDNKIKDYKHFLPLVSNSEKIAKHSFLPFIKFNKLKYKYKTVNRERKLIKRDSLKRLKVREIMYAGHLDTLIYVWYQCLLEKSYNEALEKNSLSESILAYRRIEKSEDKRGKCNIDFAHEIFSYIKESKEECTALTFDIENFFPSLSHEFLKEKWCEILNATKLPPDHYNIFKSLTRYTYVDLTPWIKKLLRINTPGKRAKAKNLLENNGFSGEKFRNLKKAIKNAKINIFDKNPDTKGIPQGSPLSGLLANIYLLDFDKKINKIAKDAGGIYRRYSDDIIIVCPIEDGKELEEITRAEISINKDLSKKPYLVIKEEKTKRISFMKIKNKLIAWKVDKNFEKEHMESLQYLGFEFDGETTFIRSGSIARFNNQLKYGIAKTKKVYKTGPILKKKLLERYTPMGKSNFLSYVNKANKIVPGNRFLKQLEKGQKELRKI